jgi:hypothetical protein
MFAPAFAAITALKVILFSEYNVTFRTVIKILGIELLTEHLVETLDGAAY